MKSSSTVIPVVIILAALGLAVVLAAPVEKNINVPASSSEPAQVTVMPGSDRKVVVLTEQARARLDIQTAEVAPAPLAVPYAAVLYETDGSTWVYTNPEPLAYVRHQIEVDRIEGERAFLVSGPTAGEAVVTTGAAELLGFEFGVGK